MTFTGCSVNLLLFKSRIDAIFEKYTNFAPFENKRFTFEISIGTIFFST